MISKKRSSAQALVEFALVIPLILLIILVFIDLGRIVYYYSTLNNAVREGARYAIVHQFSSSTERTTEIRQKVVGYSIALPLNSNDISVYCDQDTTNLDNPCTTYVTVSAKIEIEPLFAFVARMLGAGNTFNITAQSTMQMTPYGNQ